MLFFFFLNETLHHLPSWSKRGIIAVKKAPYGSEGKARSVLVAMFKTAAANTLCKCMNLFQRSHRGTDGEGEMRSAHSPSLDWFEQPPVNRGNVGKEEASIFNSSLREGIENVREGDKSVNGTSATG